MKTREELLREIEEGKKDLDLSDRIIHLEDYFITIGPLEKSLSKDPSLVEKAIRLLKKIQEISGEEYAFFYIQEIFSPYCIPCPIAHRESKSKATRIFRVYDISYFERFLEERKGT